MSEARATLITADVEADSHVTVRTIAANHHTNVKLVHEILTQDIGKVSVHGRFVPHELSDAAKLERVRCCREMLRAFNNRNIRKHLVVTDEKWFFSRPVGSPSTNTFWVDPDGDRPTVAKRSAMEVKFMAMVAVTFHGISYSKVLPRNTTIDSDIYITFLEEAMAAFSTYELQISRKAVRWENSTIQHDNARPHVSRATTEFIEGKNSVLLKQPPYSPDTNILDRMVFPKLEMERSQIRFRNEEEVQDFLTIHLQRNTEVVMQKQFEKLKTDLQSIVDNFGNYL